MQTSKQSIIHVDCRSIGGRGENKFNINLKIYWKCKININCIHVGGLDHTLTEMEWLVIWLLICAMCTMHMNVTMDEQN